ncbi:NAD(P)/FAD-dependent oxidoreductase [Bradyrhizobium sp. 61]|uniref:flavin-containing monooxygenase n=1 Tax=unclassified Bradyrhizobium TaxID=2631580 RepID=UPI001FF7D61D|nr:MULTISPECIES: NAD(P)/FAD-dependent oxidoreductase [unclassified Bradyrhizobium]MCK1281863.1 NAD(P)/FAD-dependent oxidoreductase [Bradyrhizobium sp. 61]MCK1459760.1 NAD(P)/FAD-dependent oxidoreductase [Bradyrhizobium sp. 2]
MPERKSAKPLDVIVIGAGFAGLYALHRLRKDGYSVRVLEAGKSIGGTWYWNRYPGARCDIESMQYSYSFSDEIQREWKWSQLYAPQPEILSYINFVADKLDLRRDIQLETRVVAATFDEQSRTWKVRTEAGEAFEAPFCVMATGCLSVPIVPTFPGKEKFEGEVYRTSDWPHEGIQLKGKRVGLIGTGSSGIQVTPVLAEQAEHLYVFQRTPNYSIPALNRPMDEEYEQAWKQNYPERRKAALATRINALSDFGTVPGSSVSYEEREREFERRWTKVGGFGFVHGYTDIMTDPIVNAHASEFVKKKIAALVPDPEVAKKLMPSDYGIGGKRICVDTAYFETFNRNNVTLIDVKSDPIRSFKPNGLSTQSRSFELDTVILAIGFDAITGALLKIDITGRDGLKLRDRWAEGPKNYIGMAVSGFPNMFMVTGPGSPSVFTNMVASIEQHVDWIADCIAHLKRKGVSSIEALPEAEEKWVSHVNDVANATLMPRGNSWYVGANIPGKPRVFMPYLAGAHVYKKVIEDVASKDYEGFGLA